jgi:hypothetical protein
MFWSPEHPHFKYENKPACKGKKNFGSLRFRYSQVSLHVLFEAISSTSSYQLVTSYLEEIKTVLNVFVFLHIRPTSLAYLFGRNRSVSTGKRSNCLRTCRCAAPSAGLLNTHTHTHTHTSESDYSEIKLAIKRPEVDMYYHLNDTLLSSCLSTNDCLLRWLVSDAVSTARLIQVRTK